MRIGELAEITGISEYALRFYERKGLIRVGRDNAGHRKYDDTDVEWVRFIQRLKDTGMPIRLIKEYSDLRYGGDATMPERMAMLQDHRQYVLEQQRVWQDHLEKLDAKIGIYEERIAHGI